MKTALILLGFTFAAVRTSVVPINGDEKVADADFLQKQKKVLDLYKGVAYSSGFKNENSEFAFSADQFTDQDVAKRFQETYKHGFLPKNGVFTLSCHHTRFETIRLFDVLFFAKDFETFYKVATWAKKNVNPGQFAYAYTLALIHREDTQDFALPPLYEVFPNYFVAQDTIRSLLNDRVAGLSEKKYEYNNTGYEYNYHSAVFGGPLSTQTYNPHTEFKVSYFREDVGLNTYNAMWHFRFPSWMSSPKYKKSAWFDKLGESFYNTHLQIFALYTRERIANGLPYAPPLYWEREIKIGYNPRISHPNGLSFYTRPDNFIPKFFNKYGANKSMEYEQRIYDAIDSGSYWNSENETISKLEGDSGLDTIGRLIYGAVDKPLRKYFGYLWHTALDALAYAVKTSNDNQYVGGALSTAMTSMRDPLFYSLLNRIVKIFEAYKRSPYRPYKQQELIFPGVTVNDFSSEKLITYFEHFDYEITNALPLKDSAEYEKLKFQASELRMNHKPFFYNITVTSDKAYYAIVRVFIGPKYDAEHRELSLEQKRLSLVEFDRFPVNLAAGKNVLGRNSKDSPIYTRDYEGIRQLSSRIENALKNKESFKINKRYSCGVPDRFQLPIGGKEGAPYTFYVIVSSFEKKLDESVKRFNPTCGSPKLYDYRSLGYPFDRPVHEFEFNVPNFYAEDVLIYHKSEQEINRPQK